VPPDLTETMKTTILTIIGQIGAGKSEVAKRIAVQTGARVFAVDDLRDRGCDTASCLVNSIVATPAEFPIIFESTGTSSGFEDVLAGLSRHGRSVFVVLLECSTETAMRRIHERTEWVAPVVGGSWAAQLRWTETQLRFIPADLCIPTDALSTEEAATTVREAWENANDLSRNVGQDPPSGTFTFSQLASFDICPLAYRYKYVEQTAELVETEQMFLGRQLHKALAYLYSAKHAVTEADLLSFFAARVSETLASLVRQPQLKEILERGSSVLLSHYRNTFRFSTSRTIAVEKHFSLELSAGVTFSGIIDRVSQAASGTYEVVDYKTSIRRSTSRPRIPDLLQLAAYGVAAMLEYRVPALLISRHLVPSGEEEKLPLRETDMRRIRLALLRWVTRVWQTTEYSARPGRHCSSCQFNPCCPHAATVPSPTAIRLVNRVA